MANIILKRRELEKSIKLDEATLKKISLFGTPINVTEEEVEIEVSPNRPDLLSLHGFLRAIKVYLDKDKGFKKYKVYPPEKDYIVKVESSVHDIRPYTVCAVIKSISLDEEKIKEIIDVQEKLHLTIGRKRKKAAIGIYPLEKITFPIKYEARKPQDIKFRPLESERELSAIEILQHHPAGKEYSHLLEKKLLFPIFIDAKKNILSMPPIINSHNVGKVVVSTKDIFIECSGFDFETLQKIITILGTMFADMGGKIYSVEVIYGKNKIFTPNLKNQKIRLDIKNVNRILGIDLKEKDIEKLLARMGIGYKNKTALIPAWRYDFLHEVDLIEEIAVSYGYNNFIPEIPAIATIARESLSAKYRKKITQILLGLGLLEISSYHLIKPEEAAIHKEDNPLKIENSKTEYKLLRPSLLIPALRIFTENKDNEYPQKIFEIGKIFKNIQNSQKPSEEEHLLIAITPGNYTETKQILDYFMRNLDLSYGVFQLEKKHFIEGRTASIMCDKKDVGHMGEIHPETLKKWGIKIPVAVIEISLEEIKSIYSINPK